MQTNPFFDNPILNSPLTNRLAGIGSWTKIGTLRGPSSMHVASRLY